MSNISASAYSNREAWLHQLNNNLRPLFATAGYDIPEHIRISCGWPSARALAKKLRRVGECWAGEAAADGVHQIFISPVLADSVDVAGVVVHELGHAAVGISAGHREPFKRFMREIGLQGKARSTAVGPLLRERLLALISELGHYPHVALARDAGPFKRDSARLLKLTCQRCGYTCRTTKKWITTGLPRCPEGYEMTPEGYEIPPGA